MPIPSLDKRGLLPPGVYGCTLEEIRTAFSSRDPKSARHRLFEKFVAFVEMTRVYKWIKLVYVDGSFITDKQYPGDIDVTIELPPAAPGIANLLANTTVFNRGLIKQSYNVDILPTTPALDFKDLFQTLKPEEARRRGLKADARKGILRIAL